MGVPVNYKHTQIHTHTQTHTRTHRGMLILPVGAVSDPRIKVSSPAEVWRERDASRPLSVGGAMYTV